MLLLHVDKVEKYVCCTCLPILYKRQHPWHNSGVVAWRSVRRFEASWPRPLLQHLVQTACGGFVVSVVWCVVARRHFATGHALREILRNVKERGWVVVAVLETR